METWRYFHLTHRCHEFCNPISVERIDELGRLLGLTREKRLLDLACGMGELLLRWAETYGCTGVGVDLSPYAIEAARERHAARLPQADLRWVLKDAAEFSGGERFDVSICLGASWIWKGLEGTLAALRGFTREGGLIVSGEPYWREEPPPEYLEAEKIRRTDFTTLPGCWDTARKLGLELVWMAGSTEEEWDRYEMQQAAAVDRFASEEPDDPDLEELRDRRRRTDESYLRWGRRCLGFALWAFRVPRR